MNFDVVIVGAGPSGLTMSIRLAQLAQEQERELTIWVETTENEINLTVTLDTFKQYGFQVGDKLSIQIDKRLDIDKLTQDLLKGPQ